MTALELVTLSALMARTAGRPEVAIAFAKCRCLIPADGFYEWRKTAKPKLPFAIAMKDGHPFTFAVTLEKTEKIPKSGEWLRTCTIITGEPNEPVAQIHPECR
jgi:putative SOS response-associated peptidase YedK